MSSRLTHQLSELRSTKRAPALWRAQTRERLLAQSAAASERGYSLSERLRLWVNEFRLVVAPLRSVPVVAAALMLALISVPVLEASAEAVPGSPFYGLKRAVEQVELSLQRSPAAQGLLHLELAHRRLTEVRAVPQASPDLLRQYNMNLGFAQAALAAAPDSARLAIAYDQAALKLAAELRQAPVPYEATPAYRAALGLTDRLSASALSRLVGAHAAEAPLELGERLEQEAARVAQKINTVQNKLQQFPPARSAPSVVLERKAAIVPARQARELAQQSLSEARELIQKKEFGLALQKLEESEEITQKTEAVVDQVTAEEAAEAAEPKVLPAVPGAVKGDGATLPEPAPVLPEAPQAEAGGANEPQTPIPNTP